MRVRRRKCLAGTCRPAHSGRPSRTGFRVVHRSPEASSGRRGRDCWQSSRGVNSPFYIFTAAVCVDLVGFYVLNDVPYDIREKVAFGTSLAAAWLTAYLVVSFIFLILSLVCLRGYRGPGRRTLQIGYIVLIVIQCLGFIAIVLPVPD